MKRKPILGETLFVLNINNAARGKPQVLVPCTVVKVGRKYFDVDTNEDYPTSISLYIDTWRQNAHGYSPNYQGYESRQEYSDETESYKLCFELYKAFEYGHNNKKVSLDGLRQISRIVNAAQS